MFGRKVKPFDSGQSGRLGPKRAAQSKRVGGDVTKPIRTYRWPMAEPEVFDWGEWENGKAYQLSNDELVGALFAEVSALRKRVKALEDRQPG